MLAALARSLLLTPLLFAACAASTPAVEATEPADIEPILQEAPQDADPPAESQAAPPPPSLRAAAPAAASSDEQRRAARTPLAHLTVSEQGARRREAEALTFGVPLARGLLDDAERLRVWRADDGAGLPVQARALSRWPDGSLRWVLVDTRVELPARGEVLVVVGLAEDLPPTPVPWTLEEGADGALELVDGELRWSVLRRRPRGDEVAGLSALLVDRFGHPYASRVEGGVQWVEWGPLRAVAKVRGTHRASSDKGLDIDFHHFTAWVHFLAGKSAARVEWSLENGPLHEPPGALAFRSYELLADLPGAVPMVELPGRTVQPGVGVSLAHTAAGEQRSIDGVRVAPGPEVDAWIGLRALSEAGDERTLWVHREASRENHPTGFELRPTEPLRIGLLSPAGGEEFWLDDASRKTFRLNLSRGHSGRGRAFIGDVLRPAHVALDPFEVRLTEAWGDAGLVAIPTSADLNNPLGPPRDAPTGWADWGERVKNTHTTGSPRNRLSVFLEAMQTGRADLYRWNVARAWHAMDLRPYHIRGFSAQEYPDANLYEGVPHWNERPEKRLGRSEMDQRFPEYKQDLPEKGHGYNGFDPEHMTLDDVYECYLLTGSWPALDALRSAGEAMLTWWDVKEGGKSFSSRSFGWTLRALVQVHRATGDPRYLDAARRVVHRVDETRGKGAVKYLVKQKPDPRHIADAEWDSPWMVAVALHGLLAYWHETADPIVPPMAADLAAFCLSAYKGGVFMPDVPVDGSPVPVKDEDPLGTSLWVPGGLAAAAHITGDHSPVDRVIGTWAALLAHRDAPIAMGSSGWPWWQTYRVSIRRRFGPTAVQSPAVVREALESGASQGAERPARPAPRGLKDPRKLEPPR